MGFEEFGEGVYNFNLTSTDKKKTSIKFLKE
jgi:hypothetical protein